MNYTANLSGYSTAFAENEEPDAAYDRIADRHPINHRTARNSCPMRD